MPARPEPAEQLDLRRVRFGLCVERAIKAARGRGMTIEQIEEATGVGNTTFYAWANGNWRRDPVPAKVRVFFEGLGISLDEPYAALGWTLETPRRRPTEPIIEDPDVRALMRKLTSPNTPLLEKQLLRRQIRAWVGQLDEE